MTIVYVQRIYDTGLSATVSYTSLVPTDAPNPVSTTPTGVGPFDTSTHEIWARYDDPTLGGGGGGAGDVIKSSSGQYPTSGPVAVGNTVALNVSGSVFKLTQHSNVEDVRNAMGMVTAVSGGFATVVYAGVAVFPGVSFLGAGSTYYLDPSGFPTDAIPATGVYLKLGQAIAEGSILVRLSDPIDLGGLGGGGGGG